MIELLRREKAYEANYLRQVIRFHQRLLTFQDEFTNRISPIILALVFGNNVVFILCLSQLVASSTHLPPLRYFKFAAVFFAVMLEFFVFCNSSEEADNCNELIVNAIKQSSWAKCTIWTRRYLCIMLRRVQTPNHLRFHQGTVVWSRIFFLKVVKVVYTFVNFMRTN
ncbi:hypothetical protein WDU94_001659 [Cyamophila willieti]